MAHDDVAYKGVLGRVRRNGAMRRTALYPALSARLPPCPPQAPGTRPHALGGLPGAARALPCRPQPPAMQLTRRCSRSEEELAMMGAEKEALDKPEGYAVQGLAEHKARGRGV